jgi:sigma-E factor negative regulatory protein RseC
MQEIQEGTILELDGEFAKIRVTAHEDCKDCNMCNIKGMIIIAYNPIEAIQGQMVKFSNPQTGMLSIAFMLFLFPLLSLFAGLYAGSVLASFFMFNLAGAMAICGILLLAFSIVIIFFYDKKYKLNKSNFPQIIEVIK